MNSGPSDIQRRHKKMSSFFMIRNTSTCNKKCKKKTCYICTLLIISTCVIDLKTQDKPFGT